MKKTITLSILCFLFTFSLFAQQDRNCSAMENLEYRKTLDPTLQQRMGEIEKFTKKKVKQIESNMVNGKIVGDIITIPVVVHVLYRNNTENISLAQIQSQLDVLNEDFRRTNPDADNTWSQAADSQIEFCLVTVDPNGNATTGITRKQVTRQNWGTSDDMKRASDGGVNPWNTAEYLNMWVVPQMLNSQGGTILGYAQFPGGSAATDGVVMGYNYFGRVGNVSAPFDGGRTTTHEVGHFLNLRHIWGDSNCGNDFVSDTPTHQTSNAGCPAGRVSCGSTDMYQNYMDYSNDVCMNLFTSGQKARMRATLAAGGPRRSLALSDKCGTVTQPTCTDGIQNGDETGVDCGGSSCTPCSTGPQYCASNGNNTNDEYISRVQLATINNVSGVGTTSTGYSDFTTISTDLSKGSSNTITVTPTWPGTVYNEAYAVWIDYNQDGDFTDAGEQVFAQTPTQVTPVSGSFTVPNSATNGATRMRVSMKYNATQTSCESFQYGEVEDYTVNITAGVVDTVKPVITLLGAANVNLTEGDAYSDAGATATDNVDGNLTSSIVTTGSVNTNTAGTYTINYNVSDAAGNAADQVSRTVVVSPATTSGCTGGIASFPYNEGFEGGLGAWTQSTADNINWTVDANGTPSNGTGPSSAVEGSNYIYVEASGNGTGYPNARAILTSPCFNLSSVTEATFSFRYHMFGAANMGSIDLEASNDNGVSWTSIWNETGNKGNTWLTADVNLSAYVGGNVQLRFNRVTGNTWQADIAIDAINLNEGGGASQSGCSGGITSYPYTEGYENTIGDWSQSSSDDLNWTVDNNGTPSSGTGPSSAVQGSFYIFVEASGNGTGYPNKQAIITSPCYDLSGQSSATFSFSYHMFGSNNMGTIALEASNDEGATWTSIWSESGNKGNSWQNASVNLSAYLGDGIQLRFNRVTGGTWQADIAIDNVNLTSSSSARSEDIAITNNDEISNVEISLYPNPVKGNQIFVKSNIEGMSYSVFNTIGQQVAKGVLRSNTIDVSNLDGGMYMIQFNVNDTIETRKFLKQ